MPGSSCSKTVLLLEPFEFYTTGFGEGEWFGIYVRQAHTPKIPIKFDNQSYTELNIKKSTLHASYLHICISVYHIFICKTMYIIQYRSFWVETDHNIMSMIGLLIST